MRTGVDHVTPVVYVTAGNSTLSAAKDWICLEQSVTLEAAAVWPVTGRPWRQQGGVPAGSNGNATAALTDWPDQPEVIGDEGFQNCIKAREIVQ